MESTKFILGQTCFYVGIPVDEFHAFLETPEEALGALETRLEQPDQRARAALLLPLLNLVLEVLEYDPDQLDEGDDEGAEGGGAEVEDGGGPEGAGEGVPQVALLPGPEPAGEDGGEHQVREGGGEGETPVQAQHVHSLREGDGYRRGREGEG